MMPPPLKQGDKIVIVAPARKIHQADVASAVDVLSTWGLQVELSKNLFSSKHSYFAASDEERISDFQDAIDDNSEKAIICARGGYGSTRILDQLNFTSLQNNPKWIIGFSDITAIHLKMFQLGLVSIHATMPILFARPESLPSVESLKRLLFTGECTIEAAPAKGNRMGVGKGIVIGGNLSLIADSLGTASEPDTNDAILIIEEIDEYLYKIDRQITQLKRAGKLKNLKGLIVGHMTDIKDSELPFGESIEQIILSATKDYSFPIGFRFPSGHENPNYAWIHGAEGHLTVDANCVSLTYDTSQKKYSTIA
jgi:muramoyltetrapeptide carboxypeptidase